MLYGQYLGRCSLKFTMRVQAENRYFVDFRPNNVVERFSALLKGTYKCEKLSLKKKFVKIGQLLNQLWMTQTKANSKCILEPPFQVKRDTSFARGLRPLAHSVSINQIGSKTSNLALLVSIRITLMENGQTCSLGGPRRPTKLLGGGGSTWGPHVSPLNQEVCETAI